jgi:hypothetical protein
VKNSDDLQREIADLLKLSQRIVEDSQRTQRAADALSRRLAKLEVEAANPNRLIRGRPPKKGA